MRIGTTLHRDSTNMTIAEFYERFKLGKYNFDPPYQRRGDVWSNEKKSFLIDSVLKNFPMPPIFLHQRINDETGVTQYDVIDGKQRLSAIVDFIENRVALPENFDEGSFGNSLLNGVYFDDLSEDFADYRKQLWRYTISVEYIESNEDSTVDEIFDRLNRNGEPLEPQELRNARYHGTPFMESVIEVASTIDWSSIGKISFSRMQDQEFASELFLYLLEGEPVDASRRDFLDDAYANWVSKTRDDYSLLREARNEFGCCISFINSLNLDFGKYKIGGVSHFYALFALANQCLAAKKSPTEIREDLNLFFLSLRSADSKDECVNNYRASMSSNTKSAHQRKRRIDALSTFCGVRAAN